MKFKEVKGVLLALSLVVVAPFTTPAAVITAKAAETSEETAAEENVEDPENEGVQKEKTVPAAGLATAEDVGVNEGEKETEETQYTGEDNQSVEETNEEELKEEIIKEETIKESEDTETTPEDADRIPEGEKEPAAEGTGAQDPEIDAAADAEVPEELDEVNEKPAAEENSEEAAGNTGQTETSETEYAADTEGTEDTTDTAVTTGTAVTTDTADTSDKTTSDPEVIDPSVPEGTVVDADQVTDLNALEKEAATVASTKTDGVIYYDYANGR